MRKIILTVLCVFSLWVPAAQAALSLGVSSDVINVTTGFNGATVTVFGAQDREGSIVIVVEGPTKTMTVRKKAPVFGLWAFTDSHRYTTLPTYYDMAASGPLNDIAAPEILSANRIGINTLITEENASKTAAFFDALVRIQQERRLYGRSAKPLTYTSPSLFKVEFDLPAGVASGTYKVSTYLFHEGKVVDQGTSSFDVEPLGLSARLRLIATEYGFLYGVAGVLFALMAGWLATVLLKRE